MESLGRERTSVSSEQVRAALFKVAYWERCLEQLPLVRGEDRANAARAARASLGRRHRRMIANLLSGPAGPLALTAVHATASRYALWTVRLRLDTDVAMPGIPADTVAFDDRVRAGFWDLDVTLRRQLEERATGPTLTTRGVGELSDLLAARATAVAIDIAHLDNYPPRHPDWKTADVMLSTIRSDLDVLLLASGGRRLPPPT